MYALRPSLTLETLSYYHEAALQKAASEGRPAQLRLEAIYDNGQTGSNGMNVSPAVIFRCEVSAAVGMGHLMRSRTFAAVLRQRGQRCIMVGPGNEFRDDGDAALFDGWFARPAWTSSHADAAAFVDVARASGAGRAVVDDYRADEAFQDVLANAGLIWMQHFDASKTRRFKADMIVHGSPSETEERWRPFLDNPDTEMLFGPRYAVLRPEFPPIDVRPDARAVERILVSFGGGDDLGAIDLTLRTLVDRLPAVRFAVMSGSRNPNNAKIEAWIASNGDGRVELNVQPDDVAGLFASCELAVLGGGISIYEAASCGLPMVLVALAENQLRQCAAWEKLGAATFVAPLASLTDEILARTVMALVADRPRRAAMSAVGRSAVDGRGAERLATHLLKDRTK